MAQGNFVDHVKIMFRSGHGGAGSTHFYRDRLTAKGGPDGGDGGRGAHIILRGNAQMWTLLHLKYRKHIHADNGQPGSGGNKSGASGKDIVLDVPLGTVARDFETGEVMCEVMEDGQELVLMPGGRGGQGNSHFKSATNQTPRFSQPGEPGQEGWVVLELKVLADVGLVGFPNAGKSTLLSVVSAAKPEIADYPFTTLVPQLGMVAYQNYQSFIMADIPGIIEGASEGKGLGHRFLRHIERNSILLFLVPADADNIADQYKILLKELENYDPEMLLKERVLAISKSDLIDEELKEMLQPELPEGIEHVFISSYKQEGLYELKELLWRKLNEDLKEF